MRSRAVCRPLLMCALLVLVAVVSTGCGPKIAATVNGVKIQASQVDAEIATMKKQHPQVFEGANGKQLEGQFRKRILDNLVTNILVVQEAKAKGMSVNETEIAGRVAQMGASFPSQAAFEAALTKSGTSIAALKERIRTQILTQRMVEKITGKVKVSDAEARDYYRVNKEMFGGQPRVRVQMIKLGVLELAKAKKLIAELKKPSANFLVVANRESIDTASKPKGGDLGLKPLSEIPPELSGAARTAAINAIVGPIRQPNGIYIIKVVERESPKQKPYAAVKAQIITILTQEKQVKAFNDWIESLKKKANVNQ